MQVTPQVLNDRWGKQASYYELCLAHRETDIEREIFCLYRLYLSNVEQQGLTFHISRFTLIHFQVDLPIHYISHDIV